MSANQIGFIVRHIVQGEPGCIHVVGRCGDQPLRQGDVFDIVHLPARINDEPSLGPAHPVRLSIIGIQSYERSLSELGGGMTGTINLEGSGAESLVPGAILEPPQPVAARVGTVVAKSEIEA